MTEKPKKKTAGRYIRQHNPVEVVWARPSDLAKIVHKLARPVVVVNGTFDLLHSSHMRLIWEARKKAGTLIVAMDSDSNVAKLKGPLRPIQTWPERAAPLNYMPIDYLVEFTSEEELQLLLKLVHADLRIKGEDHISDKDPSGVPTQFVRFNGPRTSGLVERILTRYATIPKIDSPDKDL